ncbi:MAG: ribonuclease III [Rickettsiaceae bacterium]|nr:ribonuclease III [Rickettsiaceae bacterium]
MSKSNTGKISELEKRLEYVFDDKNLITEALTHSSLNVTKHDRNNERMEFLGDSVLGMIITEDLYKNYKKSKEGSLSTMRSRLVSSSAICFVARKISLREFLILSQGEEKNGGRDNPRNLENAMEAIIGAIYLDSGYDMAKKITLHLWQDLANNKDHLEIDSKSLLQEWVQSNKLGLPIYQIISSSGPEDDVTFSARVTVKNFGSETGEGGKKKDAEKKAALKFLKKYTKLLEREN